MTNQVFTSFQQIWRGMSSERRRQASTALFSSTDMSGEQRRATALLATKLNLRPQKAAKLPAEKAAGYLAGVMAVDELTAASLIRAYLFAHQLQMLTGFLDALQIPHQNGVIPEDSTVVPGVEALRAAVTRLRAENPAEDVQLYLSALVASDTAMWGNLKEALAEQ